MTDPAAGDRLRRFVDAQMEIKGIPSYAELTRLSGASPDAVAKMLGGRNSTRQTLTKVAVALGVTYIELRNAREGIAAGARGDTPAPAYLTRLDTLTALIGQLVLQNAELMAAAKLTPPVTDAMRTDLAALMASSSSLLRDAPRSGTKA